MAGGGATTSPPPAVDDPRVADNEKIWRLVPEDWWPLDLTTGRRSIEEAAFIGQVSALRESIISERDVDSAKNGKFAKWGIIELTARDIRQAGCMFTISDEPEWPREGHVLICRAPNGGKNLRASHDQVPKLTALANARRLRRVPQP